MKTISTEYQWIYAPKGYIPEIVAAARMKSGILLCTIRHHPARGILFRSPEGYMLVTTFRHYGRSNPIGGYYSTFDEAVEAGDKMIANVFGDQNLSQGEAK